MKKFFILFITLYALLFSACTPSVENTVATEEVHHTEQSTSTAPAPTRKIVGYTPDDEPVYEDQIFIPEPFYFDEYGARYILEDGTIDEYYMDEEYQEMIETPDSTAFTVISYWHFYSELRVQFRNSGVWYVYYGFEPETWDRFKHADSKGGFFNEFIKDQYEYDRD